MADHTCYNVFLGFEWDANKSFRYMLKQLSGYPSVVMTFEVQERRFRGCSTIDHLTSTPLENLYFWENISIPPWYLYTKGSLCLKAVNPTVSEKWVFVLQNVILPLLFMDGKTIIICRGVIQAWFEQLITEYKNR